MKRVVLGFSGGVDSSVCAELLKRDGYEVFGLYMDISGESARQDAIRTAEFIGIPLVVKDVSCALEQNVCRPFTEAYLRGETPNPCVICNPSVKFKTLCDYADEIGAEKVATGHYARSMDGYIYKGMPSNDQSYMLNRVLRSQAQRVLFPLGGFEKVYVRELAESFQLPVAHKPDSMEICFIPDKNYIRWMGERTTLPGDGDFIFHGQSIGRHGGIHRWTVGQRMPGLIDGRKVYISRIHAGSNTIELSLWEDLFKTEVTAHSFNPLADLPEDEPFRASVRVRHTKWENPPCTVTLHQGVAHIVCDEPVRAPAAGQSAVLYDGDKLLGGGFIL